MIWLATLWAWARQNPLLMVIAALALWGAYERHQHVGWRDYAHRLENASQAAAAAQKALRATETKTYQEKADAADANHLEGLDRARTATRAYVDAHRVRPEGGSCPAQPEREADPAGVPESLPGAAVMVTEADVRRAGEWQAYGVACHDWATSLGYDAQ